MRIMPRATYSLRRYGVANLRLREGPALSTTTTEGPASSSSASIPLAYAGAGDADINYPLSRDIDIHISACARVTLFPETRYVTTTFLHSSVTDMYMYVRTI